MGLAIVFLLVFSGMEMVGFYAPTILNDIGFGDRTFAFAATLGLGVVNLIMTMVSAAIIDRAGRKPLMIAGLFVMAACLIPFAALSVADNTNVWVRWGQIGCLVLLGATFWLTTGIVGEIVISEMYPQSIRGPASSLSHGMFSVFLIIFTLTFPLLLENLGLPVIVLCYALINVVGAIYLLRALPETKGKSLEDLGDYWSRSIYTSETSA